MKIKHIYRIEPFKLVSYLDILIPIYLHFSTYDEGFST